MQSHLLSTHLSLSTTWVTTQSSKTRMRVSGEAVDRTPPSHVAPPSYRSVPTLHYLCLGRSFRLSPKILHDGNMHTNDHLRGRHVVNHLIVSHRWRDLLDETKRNIPFHRVYDVRYARIPRSHYLYPITLFLRGMDRHTHSQPSFHLISRGFRN